MFKTIGNTWELICASWRVLQQDKRLLWFPIMSGVALLAIIAVAVGAFAATGSLDSDKPVTTAGYIVGAVFYLIATFTVIYFNSALIAAASVRLRGGTPTIKTSLQVANSHLPSIFGWACFSTTIGLLIEQLRNGGGVLKIAAIILNVVWAYTTYFVVPVLVMEGLSPFDAVKRSTSLFTATWGKQAVSNFGFALGYIAVLIVAAVPMLLAFAAGGTTIGAIVAIMVSLPIVAAGFATMASLEGIFRTALYQFVTGTAGSVFPDGILRNAYLPKENKGGLLNS